jgi:hypothetical protein
MKHQRSFCTGGTYCRVMIVIIKNSTHRILLRCRRVEDRLTENLMLAMARHVLHCALICTEAEADQLTGKGTFVAIPASFIPETSSKLLTRDLCVILSYSTRGV